MVKQQLALIGFKSSIYIAIIVFFVSCIIGYGSNLAIDTLIQKAVIAGCLTGLLAFVLVRMLMKYVPDNLGMTENTDNQTGKG
ncbi:MAG: hypothetical protein HN402_05865 [Candidatus Scalindua sp.]|jgi:uncharacterized membrane protein|nr:hypothetical protein [Candidatus Scalindua sp.]